MASKIQESYTAGYNGQKPAAIMPRGSSMRDAAWRQGKSDAKSGKPNRYTETKEIEKMTRNEFIAECTERTINPSIALENESIVEALRARDNDKVIALLDEVI